MAKLICHLVFVVFLVGGERKVSEIVDWEEQSCYLFVHRSGVDIHLHSSTLVDRLSGFFVDLNEPLVFFRVRSESGEELRGDRVIGIQKVRLTKHDRLVFGCFSRLREQAVIILVRQPGVVVHTGVRFVVQRRFERVLRHQKSSHSLAVIDVFVAGHLVELDGSIEFGHKNFDTAFLFTDWTTKLSVRTFDLGAVKRQIASPSRVGIVAIDRHDLSEILDVRLASVNFENGFRVVFL